MCLEFEISQFSSFNMMQCYLVFPKKNSTN
jgi:hypothetical protein